MGCVHIYAKNNNLTDGYESFKVNNRSKGSFSPAKSKELLTALGNKVAPPTGV